MAADRSPATAPGTLSRRPGAAPIIPNIGSYHAQRSPLSFPMLLIGNPRPRHPQPPARGRPCHAAPSCRPCHSRHSPLSFPTLLIGNPRPRHPQPPARGRPCHAAPSCPTFASVIPDVVNRESTTPAPSAAGPVPPQDIFDDDVHRGDDGENNHRPEENPESQRHGHRHDNPSLERRLQHHRG